MSEIFAKVRGVTKSYRTAQITVKIISFVFLTLATFVVLIPFAWLISTSLKPDLKSVFIFPPEWIPNPPAWRNYIKAWQSAPFNQYFLNSVIVSVAATTLQVMNGCLCGYVFSHIRFPGRDIIFVLFLAVLMIPAQVTVVPNYIILSRLSWLDTYWALIVPFMATAFGTFLIRQAFLSIPNDLVDAAVMDGASHLGILRHIMIPLSKPMIVTFAMLTFNWRWNDYFWVLIMTNSDRMRTLPVGLIAMSAGPEGGANWQILMAATFMVIAPIMLLFGIAQRSFIEGITYSGLKGI
jgi:ABC-type glycerol-3-phosphate transport system permease component